VLVAAPAPGWCATPGTAGRYGPFTGLMSVTRSSGQAGLVSIEASVKKRGLGQSAGTPAPPPAYGPERGSILLVAGDSRPPTRRQSPQGHVAPHTPITPTKALKFCNGESAVISVERW